VLVAETHDVRGTEVTRAAEAIEAFGTRDSWVSLPDRMHHSRDEVLSPLTGFEIEMMNEEEKDDPPDVRKPKHWQLFHVVARKR
jgi:tellurite methyltransferase